MGKEGGARSWGTQTELSPADLRGKAKEASMAASARSVGSKQVDDGHF